MLFREFPLLAAAPRPAALGRSRRVLQSRLRWLRHSVSPSPSPQCVYKPRPAAKQAFRETLHDCPNTKDRSAKPFTTARRDRSAKSFTTCLPRVWCFVYKRPFRETLHDCRRDRSANPSRPVYVGCGVSFAKDRYAKPFTTVEGTVSQLLHDLSI